MGERRKLDEEDWTQRRLYNAVENGSRRRTPRAQLATRELELTAMDDGENLTRFSGARCFWTEAGRR